MPPGPADYNSSDVHASDDACTLPTFVQGVVDSRSGEGVSQTYEGPLTCPPETKYRCFVLMLIRVLLFIRV